jgi:hypothetical protein
MSSHDSLPKDKLPPTADHDSDFSTSFSSPAITRQQGELVTPSPRTRRAIYSPAKRPITDFVDVLVLSSDEESTDSPVHKKVKKSKKDPEIDEEPHQDHDDDQGEGGVNVLVKEEAATDEEPEETCCTVCGCTPCKWKQYKVEVIEFAKNNHFLINHKQEEPFDPFSYPTENFDTMTEEEKEEVKNFHQEYKKKCFRFFVSCKYGKLGKGNHTRLAICVEDAIQRMFPNHDNSSIGYHNS